MRYRGQGRLGALRGRLGKISGVEFGGREGGARGSWVVPVGSSLGGLAEVLGGMVEMETAMRRVGCSWLIIC
jgi:hypothetical protein